MQSILHSLNISTLATWLSVAGFGTVGVVVEPGGGPQPVAPLVEESILSDADFTLGDVADPGQPDGSGGGGAAVESIEMPPETPVIDPPELPELAEFAPLPEVPALPAPAPVTRRAESAPRTTTASQRSGGTPSRRKEGSTASRGGSSSASSSSGGGGMSATARLAAGRMPAPAYPAISRRKGQTGTVVVEFTVDRSGRVIAAHAAKPSPWPLLDHEAVRTVRKWKFPPGDVMKLRRPIVFQLR